MSNDSTSTTHTYIYMLVNAYYNFFTSLIYSQPSLSYTYVLNRNYFPSVAINFSLWRDPFASLKSRVPARFALPDTWEPSLSERKRYDRRDILGYITFLFVHMCSFMLSRKIIHTNVLHFGINLEHSTCWSLDYICH